MNWQRLGKRIFWAVVGQVVAELTVSHMERDR